MNKLNLNLLLLLFISTTVYSQDTSTEMFLNKQGSPSKENLVLSTEKISPFTALLITELAIKKDWPIAELVTDTNFISRFGLIDLNNILYTNAFLVVDENFNSSDISILGVKQGSKSNKFMTALIPIFKINEVKDLPSIKYLQIGEPAKERMNSARSSTWVDWVHQGYQLSQSYKGNGVVIGIIDAGIDYTHPNFYDGTGVNNYRIKRVWEQNTSGTPPSGFNYGRELTSQSAILNAQRDKPNASHGTHVTGIAAGAGGGANTTYTGVAPESDIVIVSYKFSVVNAEIADGIAYIMNYASSVGKPCVINMSLGQHIGPHDGTSPFDQYCDNIVGQGKLLVGAAGNEGSDALYLSKTFTANDSAMFSFVRFPGTSLGTNGSGTIDIWGNVGQNFKVAVNIYNTNTNQFEAYTPYIFATANSSFNYTLYDNDFFSPDACIVTIAAETNPQNNKRRVLVSINHTAQDDNYRWALIEIIAYNTQTKMWGGPIGGEIEFVNNGYNFPILNGSTNSTIGEIGGTGNSIITVGAYTSKNSWTALNGNTSNNGHTIGAIADFSSKGPTADGRTKPDITAPGNVIVASVSRFDNSYPSSSNNVVSGVTNGTNTWYFGKMQGTSMASPMVSGVLALWLQAYPNLTPTQAKTLLKDNAWTDSFTGTIPSNGSNTWGWGKIDAHEGMKDLLTKIPPQPTITPSGSVSVCQGQTITLSASSGFSSYLWSNGATTQSINVSSAGSYTVRVTNNQGYISPWSAPKVVTVNPKPNAPTFAPTSGCSPLTVTASSSNCAGCSYQWSTGASGTTATFTANTNFTVTVTNSNNCTTSANGSVTITGQPAVAITPANPAFCIGGSIALTVSPSGNSYSWSGPNGFTSNAQSPSVNMSGTYSVTVTNPGSCSGTATASKSVTQHSSPTANAGNDVTIQQGNSTTLTATGGTSYTWSNGANSASTTVSPIQTTTYTVTVTDANGCTATDNVTVFVQSGGCNNIYTLNATSVNISATGGTASVNLTTDGGCSWNVNAGGCVGWVSPVNPNGVGSATVSFSVQPNPLPSQRTCFVTIAGELFTIIQEAAPTTGISEISDIQNISLFPNPNNGKFTLIIESTLHQKLNSNLYNTIGQLVLSREVETNVPIEFDISGNAKGIYFLQIQSEKVNRFLKVFME